MIVSVSTKVPLTIATPEDDRDGGERGAQLAADQVLQRDGGHD